MPRFQRTSRGQGALIVGWWRLQSNKPTLHPSVVGTTVGGVKLQLYHRRILQLQVERWFPQSTFLLVKMSFGSVPRATTISQEGPRFVALCRYQFIAVQSQFWDLGKASNVEGP